MGNAYIKSALKLNDNSAQWQHAAPLVRRESGECVRVKSQNSNPQIPGSEEPGQRTFYAYTTAQF